MVRVEDASDSIKLRARAMEFLCSAVRLICVLDLFVCKTSTYFRVFVYMIHYIRNIKITILPIVK